MEKHNILEDTNTFLHTFLFSQKNHFNILQNNVVNFEITKVVWYVYVGIEKENFHTNERIKKPSEITEMYLTTLVGTMQNL